MTKTVSISIRHIFLKSLYLLGEIELITKYLLHICAKCNTYVWGTERINNFAWGRSRKALWETDTFKAKFNEILSTYLPLPAGSIWHLIHPHLIWILFSSHPSSESFFSVHPLNVKSPVYFRCSNLFTLHIPPLPTPSTPNDSNTN